MLIICLTLSNFVPSVIVKHDIVVKIENNNVNEAYNEVYKSIENAVESITGCNSTSIGMFSLLLHLYFNVYKWFLFF